MGNSADPTALVMTKNSTSSFSDTEISSLNTHVSNSVNSNCLLMAKKGDLDVLPPQPVADERSPLLGERSEPDPTPRNDDAGLEEQAQREQREHDVGATMVADEPSTKKLLVTMGSLWTSTFFAALGITRQHSYVPVPQLTYYRCHNRSNTQWSDCIIFQFRNPFLLDCIWLSDCECCFSATVRKAHRYIRSASRSCICHSLLRWWYTHMWTRWRRLGNDSRPSRRWHWRRLSKHHLDFCGF